MQHIEDELTPMSRLWRMLKPDRTEIKNVYVYAFFNGIVKLSLPLGIQAIINIIQAGQINSSWILLVSIVILGVSINGLLNIFQLRIVENLQQKIFARAAFEFAYRIPKFRLDALVNKYAPEMMNRFFDVISIQKGLSKLLIDFSSAFLIAFFGFILLSLYHPLFFVLSLSLIILVYIAFKLTAQRGLETSIKESTYKYQLVHWLEEVARTSSTFKLAGKTDFALNRVDDHVSDYLEARESHFKILIQQFTALLVFKTLLVAGLLILGGLLVMEQLMNIGQFVAAEVIILMIISSIEKFYLAIEVIYDMLTSLHKVGQVTDIELEKKEGIDLNKELNGLGISISLENLSFSYNSNSKKVIDGLSLHIDSGDRVLITGMSGCGKSSLIKVIAGFYTAQSGTVSFSGFNIENISSESLRREMGYCLSQEQIFEGSILDNITLGRQDAGFDNVMWAVKNLLLLDFIKNQKNGFDTMLQPGGDALPTSITQKLLIARAIVVKPKLLMLRYTLENIDKNHRKQIIEFLTDQANNWTLIFVSKNQYLASKCKRLIYLESGKIHKEGSYEEMKGFIDLKFNGPDA